MKRIAVLIFVLISMILCVNCGGSDSYEVNMIVIYTEPATTTETVGTADIDYIINRNTGKFHYPNCPSVDLMAEHNQKEYTGERDDLISQGYEPCKRCDP